jgi:hypothetical protein
VGVRLAVAVDLGSVCVVSLHRQRESSRPLFKSWGLMTVTRDCRAWNLDCDARAFRAIGKLWILRLALSPNSVPSTKQQTHLCQRPPGFPSRQVTPSRVAYGGIVIRIGDARTACLLEALDGRVLGPLRGTGPALAWKLEEGSAFRASREGKG